MLEVLHYHREDLLLDLGEIHNTSICACRGITDLRNNHQHELKPLQ